MLQQLLLQKKRLYLPDDIKMDAIYVPDPSYVHWIELNHPEDGLVDLFDFWNLLIWIQTYLKKDFQQPFNTLPSEK